MLYLAAETHAGWLAEVEADLPTLLVDHAHCEKKAASTAIAMLFKYPEVEPLQLPLSALAREEMEHFDVVLGLCRERDIPMGKLTPAGYAGRLLSACRLSEPERLVDTLLCCALIEARSCERMRILAEGLSDSGLRQVYGSLLASEARHHQLYADLAAQAGERGAVRLRLQLLAEHEAGVIHARSAAVRMHSGPLAPP